MTEADFILGSPFVRLTSDCAAGAPRAPARPAAASSRKRSPRCRARRGFGVSRTPGGMPLLVAAAP